MRRLRGWTVMSAAAITCLASPDWVHACAVCWGNPDDPQTKGAQSAILLLIGVTAGVLTGFAAFMAYLWHRGRNPIDPVASFVDKLETEFQEKEVIS